MAHHQKVCLVFLAIAISDIQKGRSVNEGPAWTDKAYVVKSQASNPPWERSVWLTLQSRACQRIMRKADLDDTNANHHNTLSIYNPLKEVKMKASLHHTKLNLVQNYWTWPLATPSLYGQVGWNFCTDKMGKRIRIQILILIKNSARCIVLMWFNSNLIFISSTRVSWIFSRKVD